MIRSPLSAATRRLLPRQRLCPPALSIAFRYGSKMENGQRIYTSNYPSVMGELAHERTLYEFMMKRIKKADPNKVALIQAETGEEVTYARLEEHIERLAAALYHKGGVRKGDTVSVSLMNSVLFPPVVYGILRLGARVSTVNPVADPESLAFHVSVAGSRVLLSTKFYQKNAEGAVDRVMRETNKTVGVLYPEELLTDDSIPPIPADYDGVSGSDLDDTIFIPFSSGTTGLPKGVQLTNKNIIVNTLQTITAAGLNQNDKGISVLPYFHIFGFTANLNVFLAMSGTQVVMGKYSVDTFVEVIEKYKTTFTWVAPPIVVSLIKNAESFKHRDLSSMRGMRSGAAPLGGDVQKACEKVFTNCSVAQGYGMTEMSPITNAVPLPPQNEETGHTGPLAPDTELRIVKVDDNQQSGADKSAGIDAEEGEEGEIWYRGPQQMKGYLNQEDTDKCMQDGWYRTGDIGRVDPKTEDLYITDRLKELIKYKGFQVSPATLEAILLDHPWVNDCIVLGVTDPRDVSFEVPRALVLLKPDLSTEDVIDATDNILNYIMKRVPPYQRLHGGVRIVKEIPRNASGKLLRRVARQQEAEYMKKSMERVGLK